MTWLRKMRPVLIVLGLALVVGSMVGARALSHGSSDASCEVGRTPSSALGPRPVRTRIGVDADPPPVQYGF